jgi:hypothetical protein
MDKQHARPEPAHQPRTRKGEEHAMEEGQEPGRHESGRRGADRPTGKSTARHFTGINPKDREPIDQASPTIPPP